MSMRTFWDTEGKEWQAFDVVPRVEERRSYDRRTSANSAYPDSNDRRGGDRRVTVGRQSPLATVSSGWLCFERPSGVDRRRLSPIPADWKGCSETTLEAYRREARPVRQESLSLSAFAERGRD